MYADKPLLHEISIETLKPQVAEGEVNVLDLMKSGNAVKS